MVRGYFSPGGMRRGGPSPSALSREGEMKEDGYAALSVPVPELYSPSIFYVYSGTIPIARRSLQLKHFQG